MSAIILKSIFFKKENSGVFTDNDERILSIMLGEIGFVLENVILRMEIKNHLKKIKDRNSDRSNLPDRLKSLQDFRTILHQHDYAVCHPLDIRPTAAEAVSP